MPNQFKQQLQEQREKEQKEKEQQQMELRDVKKVNVRPIDEDEQKKREAIDLLVSDYLDYLEKLTKTRPEEPKPGKDGGVNLSFPSEKDAENFFNEQAEKNRRFIVVDPSTDKVLFYSNGDGSLHRPDKDVLFSKFEMPEPEQKSFKP
ncbi:hypothetical protein [Legionella septentrionalis]|uniref:hypothetical protein n=1 Tax=Legionella septentrionalis TaxID=2498109 RepID=UPI000F8C3B86|nr:hypothetical protein [Legionella septentrionalis]RUQ97999.1 hypothetical protein ELY11_05985 [Legionella septentrionalis]RUR09027.1 hypothetical protein ELY14_09905 [Legionella septentrionalis]